MPDPSPLPDLFLFVLALTAIFLPLGVLATIVTRDIRPSGRNRNGGSP